MTLVEETILGDLFDRFTIVPLITVKVFREEAVGFRSFIHVELGICLEKGYLNAFNFVFENNIFLRDEWERSGRGVNQGEDGDLDVVVIGFFDGFGFSGFKE